jgi:hypothetical protein
MVQMGPTHLLVSMEDLPGNNNDKTNFHETCIQNVCVLC